MESRNKQTGIERQPSLIRGGRGLLFERLCEENPGAHAVREGRAESAPVSPVFRAHELDALSESVVRELRCLLNTRLPFPAGSSDESSQTVMNYGLPDFSHLNAASPGDREILARLIERKITAFEPRLRQVRISLEPHPVERGAVTGSMRALLQTESISEPVEFLLARGRSGRVLVGTAAPAQS
jgi:type VI secretion system lysozyme-like protein